MRLIDAEPLELQIKECADNEWNKRVAPISWSHAEEKFLQRIEDAPTVDAVSVLRCKDCKWYQESEKLSPNKFCFRLQHPTENRKIGYNFADNDFCSYGERKDGKS